MVQYESNAEGVKKEIRDRGKTAREALGLFVLSEITVRAPVLSGHLRDSYSYTIDDEEESVTWGSPVDYAPYVELGTSKMGAQEHLLPAVMENRDRINRLLGEIYGE